MKKSKYVLLALIFWLVGCQFNPMQHSEIKYKRSSDTYSIDFQDLMIRNSDGKQYVPKSKRFQISVKIGLQKDYIVYNTKLYQPRIDMKNVVISFILRPSMFMKLTTPTHFFSSFKEDNIVNMDVEKINEYNCHFGLPVGNAVVDYTFMRDYKYALVKVSWFDVASAKLQSEYEWVLGQPEEALVQYLSSRYKES